MSAVDGASREALLERRASLETELNQLTTAVADERAKSLEQQEQVRAAREAMQAAPDDAADTLREDWYLAAYQDAQQATIMAHSVLERYCAVASMLLECQQELMQGDRVHRRGAPHEGA